jgi:hypothetical protein
MKVIFTTNLDKYKGAFLNRIDLPVIPRIGECVLIKDSLQSHFRQIKLPIKLKVTNVTYNVHTETELDQHVIVELWYDQTDLELMKLSKINPF